MRLGTVQQDISPGGNSVITDEEQLEHHHTLARQQERELPSISTRCQHR
jgi:hypothetical protein